MRTDDGFEDPVAGLLRADIGASAWRGRAEAGGESCELTLLEALEADLWADDPRASGLERLRQGIAGRAALLPVAVRVVCAAREARLGWRSGPDLSVWSLIELQVDRADGLWLTVYEGETDEYSLWAVRIDAQGQPGEVRRGPFTTAPPLLPQFGVAV